jgi:hypothetical protein
MDLSIQLERQTRAIFVGEPTGASVNSIGEMNPSFEAYRARRDPALEAILAYGREQ